jgi:hypothetical protein
MLKLENMQCFYLIKLKEKPKEDPTLDQHILINKKYFLIFSGNIYFKKAIKREFED